MSRTISDPSNDNRPEASGRCALLVCRDAASSKWGPRWLSQAGFDTTVTQDPALAIETARALQPSIVIVESSLRDRDGKSLYRSLSRHRFPTIVLCGSSRDMQAALQHDSVNDVIRKPFDWQLISRRAAQIATLHINESQLDEMRDALATAQTDVSELRHNLERTFETDELTQLPTRQKFRRLLEQTLASADSGHSGVAVLVVRINGFRLVNEALGFEQGNCVLVETAARLHRCLGERATAGTGLVTATLGRLGGISFSVAMTSVGAATQVESIATRILQRLGQPVKAAGRTLYLSASIGAATLPDGGYTADQLIHHAESAALEARQRGGGFQLYKQPAATSGSRMLHLDTLLHEAIEDGQLHLEYQPILDVAESRVVGAEALLRWNHPREGLISPTEFVPVAERSGLMPRIGAFVIDAACRQLRQWLDAGCGHLRMAINLSLAQLHKDDIVTVVGQALAGWDVPAHLVELELSERGVVGRDPQVLRQLHLLKALGLRLSIDDFGTGDASIGYLKDLPIDALKIDRSYVDGALMNERDATIAAGIAALARRLGLTVVAEGVEVAAQIDLLREWGCHQYQGFYFSPAVPAGRFLPLAARANQRLTAAEGHVRDLV